MNLKTRKKLFWNKNKTQSRRWLICCRWRSRRLQLKKNLLLTLSSWMKCLKESSKEKTSLRPKLDVRTQLKYFVTLLQKPFKQSLRQESNKDLNKTTPSNSLKESSKKIHSLTSRMNFKITLHDTTATISKILRFKPKSIKELKYHV